MYMKVLEIRRELGRAGLEISVEKELVVDLKGKKRRE